MEEKFTEEELFEHRIEDLEHKIRLFRERIKKGMSDPNAFMTLSQIEREWCELSNSTEVIYSDIIKDLASSVDEKAIVKQKNEFRDKGITLKADRRDKKKILTLQGEIELHRQILIPVGEESRKRLFDEYESKSIAPLDIYLGIDKLPFKISPNLMLQMAFWCQNQGSYQAAEDMIRATLGLTVNDDTMRMVTNYVGKLVFDRDKEKAARARLMLEKGIDIPKYRKNDAKSILYIEMDGSVVNTRIKANGSSWKENKLGCVFSSDNIHYYTNSRTGEKEHRIEKCEYVSYLGSASEFKWHLFALALENNYDPEREVVILSDGAPWIRNLSEELFPGATLILDLFHLFENVHKYAKGLFPEDSAKASSWAKPVCEKLEDGKWKEVLEKDVEDKAVLGFNLHSYIESNSARIDYPTYKKKGYFVGSGAIESGNKAVVQKRLKLAGMRWNTESAQYLLTLRAKYSSGRWISDVEAAVGSLFSITPEVLKIPKK